MSTSTFEETFRKMQESYGSFMQEAWTLELNPDRVPDDLVAYIPYAAIWGISDDLERERLIVKAPEAAKADLVRAVRAVDDRLDEWLGGVEASSPTPSNEYIAFSAMRMAADFV